MTIRCLALGVLLWAIAPVAQAQLMLVDSGGDRVMLFDPNDGSVLDENWLTDINAQGWAFTTPKEATIVDGEIWVADQIEDAVHRFDPERNFLSSIETGPNGAPLDNIRSLGFDGQTVYVVNAAGQIGNAVVTYDAGGNNTGSFAVNGSCFDAEAFEGDVLVTNSTTHAVQRYRNGQFLEDFAVDLDFAEQLVVLPDGTVLVANAIAPAGERGLYHYEPDGELITFVDVQSIGNPVVRGGYLLGNGSYLVSSGGGIYTAEPDGQGGYIFTKVSDADGQYVTTLSTGCGERARLKARCKQGGEKVVGKLKRAEPNTAVTFRLDGGNPQGAQTNNDGKAKTRWKNQQPGPHEVTVCDLSAEC
ncbi:MAG: hypothetical protein C4547_13450 [Phycisphaerales bacterium]|nr:MAG: hypothetical protein C4547_13450 [Phycisphaerales bacterium]